jgi:hypothetical protein
LNPESKLRRRRDKLIESLKECGRPFVLAYAATFDMEQGIEKANVYGCGFRTEDVHKLAVTLLEAANEHLGTPEPPPKQSCSLGPVVLEEECSS